MGRQIWIEVWNNKNEKVFDTLKNDDYFCGRNAFTDIIAYNAKGDDIGRVDFTDWDNYQYLRARLSEEQRSSDATLDELEESIAAAQAARRHASTVEAFYDFTELIKQLRCNRADGDWELGHDMMSLMVITISQAATMISLDKSLSSDGYAQMELIRKSGWHLYWVVSE